MIFSYSRLLLYETCPRRFYFRYILKLVEKVSKPLALGKAVHKAIEKIIEGMSVEDSVLEGFTECDFHPEVSYDEITRLVKNAPVFKNMGETEVHFCLPLSNDENAPKIQGYIDLVTDSGAFTDWKTNWKPYGHANRQLGLYAWALSKMKGIDLVEGSLYFLRFKKEYKYFFSQVEIEESRQWALNLANEINFKLDLLDMMPEKVDEIFSPTFSSACQHCPFVLECHLKNIGKGEDLNNVV